MEKNYVTISRHWNKPQIHTRVHFSPQHGEKFGGPNDTGSIAITMELNDFVGAVLTELGEVEAPTKLLNWKRLTTVPNMQQKVNHAVDRVVARMKEESAKVMVHHS